MVQYPTTVDRAFAALADPTRRAVLERLGSGSATISELAEPFGMSLTGMKKHIRLLEEAELVTTEKVGRVRRCMLAPYAFEGISTWLQRLDRFAQVVERTKGAPRWLKRSPRDSRAEEKAAMKERAAELKAEKNKADGEKILLAKVGEMKGKDRAMAKRIHEIVTASRAVPPAEDLVRDARVGQRGRQGRLLLPGRGEVQVEVRDVRLQRPWRTSTRAPCGRPSFALTELTASRREEDRHAREEGRELR